MRFLLTRSWVAGLLAAVVFAVVCVGLGVWQWDRRIARLEANQLVVDNYRQEPASAQDLLPAPGGSFPPGQEWRPVAATGEYLTAGTTLLRQRPLDGVNGFHVLVPLLLDEPLDGTGATALLVDRGFLPAGDDAGSVEVPAPPAGVVSVVVHLRPGEAAYGEAPACQTRSVDLPAIADGACVAPALAGSDAELVDAAYGELVEESPTASPAPQLLPPPEVDEGPHLSYAFQWWVFALGGFVGYGVVARRHAADLRAEAGERDGSVERDGDAPPDDTGGERRAGSPEHEGTVGPVPSTPSPRPAAARTPTGARRRRPAGAVPVRRRPSAEDEEDALVDAAERARGGRPG